MQTFKKIASMTIMASSVLLAAHANGANTLENVQKRGKLVCGVSGAGPGFSFINDKGEASGLDVDICRAVAAASLGDANHAEFKPLTAKTRFTALTSGEIDMLSRVTTHTMSRDVLHGDFAGVNYYDGQGFLIRKDLGVKSAKELDGAILCTGIGTTAEQNATDFFKANGLEYEVVVFEQAPEITAAFEAGRCDVLTNDRSGLASMRTRLRNPEEYELLPEVISKEPLGPMVRHGDSQWEDIVRWSFNCMVNAEELGITSSNVDQMLKSENPEILRVLGVTGDFGQSLSLDNAWCSNIISQVGNYSEIFERNVGKETPLKLDRGLNALWKDGGIMYAAPIR